MRGRRGRLAALALIGALVVGFAYAGLVGVLVGVRGECLETFVPLPAFETGLATRPYVQDVTATAAALLWWSPDPSAATVRFGLAPNLTETIAVEPARRHEVALTGLAPGATYAYAVETGAGEPVHGVFRTAPDPAATVTVGVLGDSGTGGDAQGAVARLLAGFAPDLVLHTGDVVYPRGALCRYGDRFFDPYGDLIAGVPFYPAIGNHDLDAAAGRAYFDVFRLPAATAEGGERFYAFSYGPVRFVVLDGEVVQPGGDSGLAERQHAWLEAELAANRDRFPWTVAVVHRPPFTSSTNDVGDAPVRDAFVTLLEDGGVDLVLAGHVHAYERTVPVDGVTYVVTGGGGASLHDVEPGGEIAVAASVHHALRLTASPTALTIEAIATDGTAFDRILLTPNT